MTSRTALLLLLGCSLAGCFSSTSRGGAPADEAEPLDEAAPLVIVDECVATAFAWENHRIPREPDRALLFANSPLFSPDYQLELYGAEIWVEIDASFHARYAPDGALPGIEDVVFGRRDGEETWRILEDPEAVCPPLPAGTEWPTEA